MTPTHVPGRSDAGAHPEDPGRRRVRPTVLAAGPGLTSMLVIVVSSLVLAERLPARVPSRWGLDGVVETLPLWGLTALLLVAMGLFSEPWLPFAGLMLTFICAMLVSGAGFFTGIIVAAFAAWAGRLVRSTCTNS